MIPLGLAGGFQLTSTVLEFTGLACTADGGSDGSVIAGHDNHFHNYVSGDWMMDALVSHNMYFY